MVPDHLVIILLSGFCFGVLAGAVLKAILDSTINRWF